MWFYILFWKVNIGKGYLVIDIELGLLKDALK